MHHRVNSISLAKGLPAEILDGGKFGLLPRAARFKVFCCQLASHHLVLQSTTQSVRERVKAGWRGCDGSALSPHWTARQPLP